MSHQLLGFSAASLEATIGREAMNELRRLAASFLAGVAGTARSDAITMEPFGIFARRYRVDKSGDEQPLTSFHFDQAVCP